MGLEIERPKLVLGLELVLVSEGLDLGEPRNRAALESFRRRGRAGFCCCLSFSFSWSLPELPVVSGGVGGGTGAVAKKRPCSSEAYMRIMISLGWEDVSE